MKRKNYVKFSTVRKPVKKSIDKKQNIKIRRLENMCEPEVKQFTTFDGASNIQTARANPMVLFNFTSGLAQGVTGTNRIGDEVCIHKIDFRLICTPGNVLTNSPQVFRSIIYQDNRYSGTDLTGAQILQSYSEVDGNNSNMLSPHNPDYVSTKLGGSQHVRILYDKTHGLTDTGNVKTTVYSYIKTFKKPLKVKYVGSTATQGQVLLALFPGIDATAGNNPLIALQKTIYYTDS